MLPTLCIILALVGVLLTILGAIPATRAHIPGGVSIGLTLFLVGVVAYVILVVSGLT